MGRFKKNEGTKQSWLKKHGLDIAEKGMEIAQQAVVYAGLFTDPHSASIALHEMNRPTIERLADSHQTPVKTNKNKINRFKKPNKVQKKKRPTPSKAKKEMPQAFKKNHAVKPKKKLIKKGR